MPPLPPIPLSMPTQVEPRRARRPHATTLESTPRVAIEKRCHFARDLSDAARAKPVLHAEGASAKSPALRKPSEPSASEAGVEPMPEDVMTESDTATAAAIIPEVPAAPTAPPADDPQATVAPTLPAATGDVFALPDAPPMASTAPPEPVPPPASDQPSLPF